MNSSSNRFGATGDTPFCEVRSYKGRSLFLFAVFACFAVENITDTPFKFYEPRTTRTTRTRRSRQYKLSRLEIQRTLPLNSMNREHSEGYEQGEADQTNFSRLSRVSRLKIQRTLPFLFAVFAPFAVKNTADTPFFVRGFRAFRG